MSDPGSRPVSLKRAQSLATKATERAARHRAEAAAADDDAAYWRKYLADQEGPTAASPRIPWPDSFWLRIPGREEMLYVEAHQVDTKTETIRSEGVAEPDLSWKHTDPAGHLHQFVPTDDENASWLPSLVKSYRHIDCDGTCSDGGGCEGYDIPVWHCRECGAEVEPGMRTNNGMLVREIPISEAVTYTLTVVAKEPLPDVIEGAGLVRIDGETGDEQRWPIQANLTRSPEVVFTVGKAEVTATYTGQEDRPVRRRRPRL